MHCLPWKELLLVAIVVLAPSVYLIKYGVRRCKSGHALGTLVILLTIMMDMCVAIILGVWAGSRDFPCAEISQSTPQGFDNSSPEGYKTNSRIRLIRPPEPNQARVVILNSWLCVRRAPTVRISPSVVELKKNEPAVFVITVRNNSSPSCVEEKVKLVVDSRWQYHVADKPLPLSSAHPASQTTLTISAPAELPDTVDVGLEKTMSFAVFAASIADPYPGCREAMNLERCVRLRELK